jgi:hypothetical protein
MTASSMSAGCPFSTAPPRPAWPSARPARRCRAIWTIAARGEWDKAYLTVMATNPFPNMQGKVCDHQCQMKCTRLNYDDPLLIREIKRVIARRLRPQRTCSGPGQRAQGGHYRRRSQRAFLRPFFGPGGLCGGGVRSQGNSRAAWPRTPSRPSGWMTRPLNRHHSHTGSWG